MLCIIYSNKSIGTVSLIKSLLTIIVLIIIVQLR